jgi:SAM-dependent methyltransferase
MGSYELAGQYYDYLYPAKDYGGEVTRLVGVLTGKGLPIGGDVLDLACGTGRHLEILSRHFQCHGLDLEPALLEVAIQRLSGVTLHEADMLDFDLCHRRFDLITCFFGSIGYLSEWERLVAALANWREHLKSQGWLAIERWILPEEFHPGKLHSVHSEGDDFKLTRMVVSAAKGTLYDSDFHYLLATPQGVQHMVERHQLRMYTHQQYLQAFYECGLQPEWHADLGCRGMFLAQNI